MRARTATAPRGWRIVGPTAFVAVLIALQLTIAAPIASAHAVLVSTSPADGANLDHAPTAIHLRFSEPVAVDAMTISIVDSHGRTFRPTTLHVLGAEADPTGRAAATAEDTEEPVEVVADLPPLGQDAYRVSWQTLSSDDLHQTKGILVFGVGREVAAAGSIEPAPDWIEVMLRWSIFLALAIALGGLLVGRAITWAGTAAATAGRAAPPAHAVARWCRSAAGQAAIAGATTCAALAWFQVWATGASPRDVLWGAHGVFGAIRIAGFALLLVAVRPMGTGLARPNTTFAVAAAGGAAIAIGTAEMGHSATSGALSTRIAADAAHLLAGATWAGGVIVAASVLLPQLRRGRAIDAPPHTPAAHLGTPEMHGDFSLVHAAVRRLAVPFAVCVGTLIVTGLYLASGVVGSVDAALLTFYGQSLLVKVALIAAVMGVLGAVNHRRLRAPGRPRLARRAVRVEAAAGVFALLLAAVLTSSQPVREPQFIRAASQGATGQAEAAYDGQVGDIQQNLSIRPNAPGPNVIVVDAFDTRRPAPAPIRSVLVRLVLPDGATSASTIADRLGDGRWSAPATIPWAGAFSVEVTIRRAGLPDLTWSRSWTVDTASTPARPPLISNAPIGGALRAAAAVTLLLTAAAGGLAMASHRRNARTVAAVGDSGEVRSAVAFRDEGNLAETVHDHDATDRDTTYHGATDHGRIPTASTEP